MDETRFGMTRLTIDERSKDFALLEIDGQMISETAIKSNHYTLILSLKGKSKLFVGHHSFVLFEKCFSIISPNQISAFKETSSNFRILAILFKPDFIRKCFAKTEILDQLLYINPEYPPVYELNDYDFGYVLRKFNDIDAEYKKESAFYLNMIRLMMVQLLYDYGRACEECLLAFRKNMNRQYQIVYDFKKSVDLNFTKFKSVQDYAGLLGISPKHLSDCTKQETGFSAMDIIHHRILLEAEYLLRHSKHNIKQITAHLNFDTSSHFSRFFKSKMGKTPLKYRNNP